MSETMIALGGYRFSVNTAAHQTIAKKYAYRWASQARLEKTPAKQFTGLGDETIELSGTIYPNYLGGLDQIENMKKEAGKGKPLLLTDGLGNVWGQFVVTEISESNSLFFANGIPQKIDFRINLLKYGGRD